MDHAEGDGYHNFPLDGSNARLIRASRRLMVGVAILGGSCLLVTYAVVAGATAVAQDAPTSLFGFTSRVSRSGPAELPAISRIGYSRPATLPLRVPSLGYSWPQLRSKSDRRGTVQAAPTEAVEPVEATRRQTLGWLAAAMAVAAAGPAGVGTARADEPPSKGPETLCDEACQGKISDLKRVKTDSGLEYVTLKEGTGPKAIVGFQAVVNYEIYTTPEAKKVYATTLLGAGGTGPIDTRVGAGALIKGMEEGLTTMTVGETRRLYIPGDMTWPKGLPASPGKPRIAPNTPVVVDMQLLYIPGLDDE